MQLLLTGTTGYIGQALTPYLIDQGHTVIALSRKPCPDPRVHTLTVPIFNPEAIEQALNAIDFDVIVHLAAAGVQPHQRNPHEHIQINSLLPGELVALAAKAGAKAVLIAGSHSEYKAAAPNEILTEDSALETQALYGASKAAGSLLALLQGNAHQLPVVVLRLFSTYGPGEASHRLLPSLLQGVRTHTPVQLSSGKQIRDFIYLEDVCRGISQTLDALQHQTIPSGTYNLCTGIGHSVEDFARTFAQLMNIDVDRFLKFGALSLRPDDVPYIVGDHSRLRRYVDWLPHFTLEEGLRKALHINGVNFD